LTVSEPDFQSRVVQDLEQRGLTVIPLGGTFDLFVDIDYGKGFFIDVKVANRNYKKWASKKEIKGINLGPQTQAIRKMRNLPIIFACDEDDMEICYLIKPEELKQLATAPSRSKKGKPILIGVKYLRKTFYDEALNELVKFIQSSAS